MIPLDGSEVADSVLCPAGMPVLVITTGPETPRLTAREKRALRPVSGGVNLFPSADTPIGNPALSKRARQN